MTRLVKHIENCRCGEVGVMFDPRCKVTKAGDRAYKELLRRPASGEQRGGLYVKQTVDGIERIAVDPETGNVTIMPPVTLSMNRHMVVQLRFDRESFSDLKELLREQTRPASASARTPKNPETTRRETSLRKLFDQIRDMEYSE